MMTDPIPTTRLQPEQLGRYELQLQEYEAFLACLQIGENVLDQIAFEVYQSDAAGGFFQSSDGGGG